MAKENNGIKVFRAYGGTQLLSVGANASVSDAFNIEDYSDFFAQYILIRQTGSFVFNLRVGSKNYFDKPLLSDLFAGNGQLANFMTVPVIMRKSDRVQLDITERTGAINVISFVFIGYEIINPMQMAGNK